MKKIITISLISVILSLPVLILSPQKTQATSVSTDNNGLQVYLTTYHH